MTVILPGMGLDQQRLPIRPLTVNVHCNIDVYQFPNSIDLLSFE